MYRYHYYINLAKTNNTILHGGKPCIPPCLGGISGREIHPAIPNQSNVSVVRGAQNTMAPDIMGHPNSMPPAHQILPQLPLRLELAVGPISRASSQDSRSSRSTVATLQNTLPAQSTGSDDSGDSGKSPESRESDQSAFMPSPDERKKQQATPRP